MPRLDRLLAHHLGLSRAEVAGLFASDAITDESGAVLEPRTGIRDLPYPVRVDGKPVTLVEHVHLLLHKPAGVVTALSDPRQAVAFALLADAPRQGDLRAVGRLDLDATGLLLWTTDGDRLHRWTHPKSQIPRTYHVALSRPFSAPPADFFLRGRDGHAPDIVDLRVIETAHPALVAPPGSIKASIAITSGIHHEVKRIFAALGSEVVGLCRVAYGPIDLPVDLAPGAWRFVDLPDLARPISREGR